MMSYYCNPINVPYRYQFNLRPNDGAIRISREGADPSLIVYQNRYYLFPSMNLSVWVSDDLVNWEVHRLPETLPLYDYAPDARVIDDYVYFCASLKSGTCHYYRTKDVLHGPYEKIEGTFPFWDPNLFQDEDGKIYFYWGCSADTPLWGVELASETLLPVGEKKALIAGNPLHNGYEQYGEDNAQKPRSDEEVEGLLAKMLEKNGQTGKEIDPELLNQARAFLSGRPYIEGAWMTKYRGRYYLQYASPGSELNVYNDAVYLSDHPLGPFKLAPSNPFSFKPGGFLPGAGHGSLTEDKAGNFWHSATSRISVNHNFERRVGLWPAGFDADHELFCDQRFGDWPLKVTEGAYQPWQDPEWMLLSFHKPVTASSYQKGHEPQLVTNENIQNWWRAEDNLPGSWLELDLVEVQTIHAVQINFADQDIVAELPGEIVTSNDSPRYIDTRDHRTQWLLEGSKDGENFEVIVDKSNVATDLPHDFLYFEEGIAYRYLKLTIMRVPFDQNPCISGLRVFGKGSGEKPAQATFSVTRTDWTAMNVTWQAPKATGVVLLWGYAPEKLYHSYLVFEGCQKEINALMKQQAVFVRVDSFNEAGVTKGTIQKLTEKV